MNKIVDKNLDIKYDRVLVDFSASWCGPCKMLSLVLDKVEDEKLIDIYKIDIDENDKLADEYKIYSVPTLIIFENKKEGSQVFVRHTFFGIFISRFTVLNSHIPLHPEIFDFFTQQQTLRLSY